MPERPELSRDIDSDTFREYYYLKQELVAFCRENGLPVSGGKAELTERISFYLETGNVLPAAAKSAKRIRTITPEITRESVIEDNFVCSEKHRAFFKKEIGDSFSFNVPFQKWLRCNSGKTYSDAVSAYYDIIAEKKKGRSSIDRQFEYNTYIRDFFADNAGKTLDDAIRCWKYKKSLKGHNRYERSDLSVL
ncbi:MAG: SAP domain-containing protein [Oscillospiraceae bacterium]|nr:SAP domain-containing protein [Oscillospiraceae bacterium]